MELKEILSKRLETLIENKKDENYQNSIPKQADGMGIPYPTFVKYINGKAECPASNIIKIARYYGVSTDYLLGNSPNPTTDEKLQGVCKYTGLSEKAVLLFKECDYTSATNITTLVFSCLPLVATLVASINAFFGKKTKQRKIYSKR